MSAITVRNLPPAVVTAVREKAKKERLSLNKAVLRLLEQALGLEGKKPRVAHHGLDHQAGTWSATEYREFTTALRRQRQIVSEMRE